ncbi:NOTC3-like protein [Mya arenaria]|uniref:NOTC3-like protein n=1 Tax=Mya arenaria TaxID=6604 RepID=A0ABY7GFF1_MYAAR|nr:NOTC3-like protein [Mya arenaria]
MRAYVNNVNVVQRTDLATMSLSDAKLFLKSSGEVQLVNWKVFNRTLSVQEREELAGACNVQIEDQLSSFDTLLDHSFDGIIVVVPSTCDPIDECSELPCGNHTCINKMDDFECNCQDGWSGDTCEIPPDFCQQNECGNHSICVNIQDSYQCNCSGNYSGTFCQTPPGAGIWSTWNDWSSCDATCGGGTKRRQRQCIYPGDGIPGSVCPGRAHESRPCFPEKCPVSADLNELQTAFSDLQEMFELLGNNSATIFTVNVDGTVYSLDESSVQSHLSVTCQSGYAGTDGLCVQCPAGTNEIQSVCRSCDLGTYQSLKGQTNCSVCPDGYTTATDLSTDVRKNRAEQQKGSMASFNQVSPEIQTTYVVGNRIRSDISGISLKAKVPPPAYEPVQ